MEKALIVSPLEAENIKPADVRGYEALIVGSEFCQNQLPGLSLIKKLAVEFPGTRLELATSLLTDKALAGWASLLRDLGDAGTVKKVIVNDLGLLHSIKKYGPYISSIGRLLLREFSKLESKWAAAYLKKKGVISAEADTYALARTAKSLGLKVSWSRPLLFKSVTAFCPFEKHFKPVCGHSCHGKLIRLTNPNIPFPLLLSEKAYFTGARESRAPRAAWREVMSLNLGA